MNKTCICGLKVENPSSEYLLKNHSSKHLADLVEKAEEKFNEILDFSLSPSTKAPHKFEKNLFVMLLSPGKILLQIFFDSLGEGDVGNAITTDDGRVLNRYRIRSRDYISIYGKVRINRWYYWSPGNSGVFPLDSELNLPERAYSYHLQELLVRNGADLTYENSLDCLENLFGVKLSPRSMMEILENASRHNDGFRDIQPPPPKEKEGEILVVSADSKGIPIRKEHPAEKKSRLKKGEKNQRKRMCIVSAVYTINKNVRTADDLLKSDGNHNPPKLCCKRVRGRLGDKYEKEEFFGKLQKEVETRDTVGNRTKVFISDGEVFLRGMQEKYFPGYIVILDIFHVKEKLWEFSHCFHREGSNDAENYVKFLYRMLLEGNVFGCLQAMKTALELPKLSKSKRETIGKIVVYFENNLDRMKYDEYLKKGLPIGSGAVESACKSLVKIRMEGCGMRWSKTGANAMLKLRAIHLNGDLNDYFDYHTNAEQKRLHKRFEPLLRKISEMSKSTYPAMLCD